METCRTEGCEWPPDSPGTAYCRYHKSTKPRYTYWANPENRERERERSRERARKARDRRRAVLERLS